MIYVVWCFLSLPLTKSQGYCNHSNRRSATFIFNGCKMSMKNMLSFPYKTIIEGFVDAGETSSPLFGFASKAVVGLVRVGGCTVCTADVYSPPTGREWSIRIQPGQTSTLGNCKQSL